MLKFKNIKIIYMYACKLNIIRYVNINKGLIIDNNSLQY